MDKYEAVVKSLQERSQHVLPLRYRRETPRQPVPVEALCEYEGEQVTSPPSRGRCRGAAGGRLPGWKRHRGRSGFCQRPSGDVSRSGDEAKVVLAPVGEAGFAAEEEQGRRGLGGEEAQPPLALRPACLPHAPGEVTTARLRHVPTLPAPGR